MRSADDQRSAAWHAVAITCHERAAEAAEHALSEAGAIGLETRSLADGQIQAVGYFSSRPSETTLREALEESLRIHGCPPACIAEVHTEEIIARDWLAEWKRHWQPVRVGRFLIAPPWCETGDAPGQLIIYIEPGMAFGTGTHETTRLCLHAIERYFRGGTLLDIGTGTGVLAIAAAKLHPEAHIEACDIDPQAIEIARGNAQANGVAARIRFYVGTIDERTPSAACVVANLTADVIDPILPMLLDVSCEHLILSGILVAQTEAVLARLTELGATQREVMIEGEWVAIVV